MGSKISDEDRNAMEANIMMAMFHCTIEQSSMMTGQFKQMHKVVFNRWQKEGLRLQKLLDGIAGEDGQEYFEQIMEVLEESTNELRKHFTKKILEKDENTI